jgi:hypothetical protein
MKQTPNYYAIVSIIRGHRTYWCRSQRAWGNWPNATHFTQNQRKAYKLPPPPAGGTDPYWVSVLHGMGANSYYVTEMELN